MSKSLIPYHLRQNKAIERNLFIELLNLVNAVKRIRKYEYVSMGGPFLEDFKVVHSNTGIDKMLSFEMEANTFARQKFNKPLSCIRLRNQTSAEFIRDYDFRKPVIVWLDFTTPRRLSSDLSDVLELATKLKSGDILKVTLNAHAASLPCEGAKSDAEKPLVRYRYLENLLGNYLPEETSSDMITGSGYPAVLFRALELVTDRAFDAGSPNYFQALSSFVYADGQTMLTYTGIVLDKNESDAFLTSSGVKDWDLNCIQKDEPISINVPDLSVKERMVLDALLPNYSAKTIQKRLKYLVGDTATLSLEGIENYSRYYKQFPYYSKVIL